MIIEPDIRASGHQVRKLPFFADAGITDWSVVESKGLQPPYIPERDGKLKLIKGELLQVLHIIKVSTCRKIDILRHVLVPWAKI